MVSQVSPIHPVSYAMLPHYTLATFYPSVYSSTDYNHFTFISLFPNSPPKDSWFLWLKLGLTNTDYKSYKGSYTRLPCRLMLYADAAPMYLQQFTCTTDISLSLWSSAIDSLFVHDIKNFYYCTLHLSRHWCTYMQWFTLRQLPLHSYCLHMSKKCTYSIAPSLPKSYL